MPPCTRPDRTMPQTTAQLRASVASAAQELAACVASQVSMGAAIVDAVTFRSCVTTHVCNPGRYNCHRAHHRR
eukprot:scaffold180_cov311-Pinguiococcus_pyrenoidosus.AAC.16